MIKIINIIFTLMLLNLYSGEELLVKRKSSRIISLKKKKIKKKN
jgi:hypothetical protein